MHLITETTTSDTTSHPRHQWVGAALVGLGEGATRRAEHAARTGRHVVSAATRIEVLEVYCGRCRRRYSSAADEVPCTAPMSRAG